MSPVRRLLIVAAMAAAACSTKGTTISGRAMEPGLKDGDRVVYSTIVGTLQRGDVVIFRYPQDESKSFVKRVIGLPGDHLSSADGVISVDGKVLSEPYVAAENLSADSWGPLLVPPNRYFMAGDNRRNSSDSRSWGLVRADKVIGKLNWR